MILRSLRLVQFEGVPELVLKDLPDGGVVDPSLPARAPARLVDDALRFAFFGGADDAERVVSPGKGFAHVEVGLRVAGGDLSLFRGVDRRGAHQVSLREDDGRRVTGGDEEVRGRLEALLGAPLDRWEAATWIDVDAETDPLRCAIVPATRAPQQSAPPAADPAPAAGAGVGVARETAERAADSLRRALRAEELAARVVSETATLVEFGSRLRRERTQTSVAKDAAGAERDRIRARLRRVREYRELLAQERASPPRRAPAAVPVRATTQRPARAAAALALACVLILVVLVFVRTDPDLLRERWLGALVGAAFVACLAGYVAAASQGGAAVRAAPMPPVAAAAAPAGDEWRAALRQRFADLGDPDDPAILDDLGRKLAAVDARIEPLRRRLEQIDEAVAACDVEVGRVAKVTHSAIAPPAEAAAGIAPGEDLAEAVVRAGRLGDSVYHAAVERDALLAGGAPSVRAAVDSVRAAVRALGDLTGESARAEEILRRAGLAGDAEADTAALHRDEDLCVRLVDELESLGTSPRPAPAAPPTAPPPPREVAWPAGTDDVAQMLGDVVERITGREFVLVLTGSASELRLQRAGDPRPLAWAALAPEVRRRLAFALRLRRAEAALPAPQSSGSPESRCVVLAERPEAFVGDADVAEFVRMVAPRIGQLIVGSAGSAPAAAVDAQSAAAAPSVESGPARGVTPR